MSLIPSNLSCLTLSEVLPPQPRGISLDVVLSIAILVLSVARLFLKTPVPEEPSVDERINVAVEKAIKKAAVAVAAKEAQVLADLKTDLERKKTAVAEATKAHDTEQSRITALQNELCPGGRFWKNGAESVEIYQNASKGIEPFQKARDEAMRGITEIMKQIACQESIAIQTARSAAATPQEDVE